MERGKSTHSSFAEFGLHYKGNNSRRSRTALLIETTHAMNHAKTITWEQMYNELRHADFTNYPASVTDRACWFLVLTKQRYTIRPERTNDMCHIKTVPVILNVCSTRRWEVVCTLQLSDYRTYHSAPWNVHSNLFPCYCFREEYELGTMCEIFGMYYLQPLLLSQRRETTVQYNR